MNNVHLKKIKTGLAYAAILALGLGVGRVASKVPQWLAPSYVEGNYQAYYPDASTRVVVYGTKSCPYCAQTRAYLNGHHIPYADIDINQGGKGQQDYQSFGETSVPVILIGNRRITGYKVPVIEAALAQLKPAAGG
ncbi:glutaredoxin family protein [Duganella sp. BJB488]|uniref:glutaredoxin family protein n=1 Tax=unclassified Duganella TaxID=2636909 RepID=UPI000E3571F5|nr:MULTISPECIES: glutaredoxin family protein [unclassified Duganella]RFP12349.1 glutaredoxin family protein [Duganella sp. BJB489]RFP16557.1 glutaredoxin family protein [Duganella sp. BJB488]RFP30713.1 glutaredoxin family protein [Duganella sp. BJB480]